MNRKLIASSIALLLLLGSSIAMACEYKVGESTYLEYANCTYGSENIVVVELEGSAGWESCVYQVQAFRPGKLLAVTKQENGKELLSTNDRSKIGNPCYMTKARCDEALKAFNQATY